MSAVVMCPRPPAGAALHAGSLAPIPNGGGGLNVLLADPDGSMSQTLGPLPAPVCRWPRESAPWCMSRPVRTLVLDGPETLEPAEQDRLFLWLESDGRDVQVVSIARRPLFALVEAGAFCPDLYYRLNTVCTWDTGRARARLP